MPAPRDRETADEPTFVMRRKPTAVIEMRRGSGTLELAQHLAEFFGGVFRDVESPPEFGSRYRGGVVIAAEILCEVGKELLPCAVIHAQEDTGEHPDRPQLFASVP